MKFPHIQISEVGLGKIPFNQCESRTPCGQGPHRQETMVEV